MSPQPRAEAPAKQQVDQVERARKDAARYAGLLTLMAFSLMFILAATIVRPHPSTMLASICVLIFTAVTAAELIRSLLEHKEALHRDSNSTN